MRQGGTAGSPKTAQAGQAPARVRRMVLAAAVYLGEIEVVGWEECPAELRDKLVTAGAPQRRSSGVL